jgi:hypothetical protein
LIYRILSYGVLLALLVAVHIVSVDKLTEKHAAFQKTGYQEQLFSLPIPILKIVAFDYKGVVSDVLFIKGLVYIGGFLSQKNNTEEHIRLSDSQWRAFFGIMNASTDLDPYFQDPYYLANAFLTWDAGMIQETNTLLDKGIRYRKWDPVLPFFSGFNYFYFLQENDKASEKLMEASRRHGNNPALANLSLKLAFKAHKTENSISFLEELIDKTDDKQTIKMFKTRIEAFRAILTLEKAVGTYKQKFGAVPINIDQLVINNIIREIPNDPYGGKFSIDTKGMIKTTSEAKLFPYQNK